MPQVLDAKSDNQDDSDRLKILLKTLYRVEVIRWCGNNARRHFSSFFCFSSCPLFFAILRENCTNCASNTCYQFFLGTLKPSLRFAEKSHNVQSLVFLKPKTHSSPLSLESLLIGLLHTSPPISFLVEGTLTCSHPQRCMKIYGKNGGVAKVTGLTVYQSHGSKYVKSKRSSESS